MRALATLLVLIAFVFGCTQEKGDRRSGQHPEKSAVTPSAAGLEKTGLEKTPSTTGSENAAVTRATRDLEQALTAVKAVASEKLEQFRTTMENKLATMSRQIEDLEARADKAAADGKQNLNEAVQALAEKRDAVQEKLDELESTSAEAWDDVKTGLETACQDLEKAIRETVAQFDGAPLTTMAPSARRLISFT